MVRAIIRGGAWKNSEDEILKAAVMKYGQQSWPRVASLLNRKTAKQCKARWYEWLDPSVKKTEWSKEEEEKLLHLAKLMPNQWRTIAPIVGRTAGQCSEHYERLLDAAQGAGTESSSVEADATARKSRTGDIDQAPENKPARPDAIDMDEEEKEMLQEARARLANTQGKKEKRKQRERELEESRKLATLQKRREMKAAGLETEAIGASKKRSRKDLDLATEIPYFESVPKGFYDVTAENESGKRVRAEHIADLSDPRGARLEVTRMEGAHADEELRRRKEEDARRLRKLMQENAPEAIKRIQEQNDPAALHRRTALVLPAPMASEPIAEHAHAIPHRQALTLPPAATRTPMQSNTILQEAKQHLQLREAPAPLSLAETSAHTDEPISDRYTTVAGILNKITSDSAYNALDSSSSKVNFAAISSVAANGELVRSREVKERQLRQTQVKQGLSALPAPLYTYEVTLPSGHSAVEAADDTENARLPQDRAESDEAQRQETLEKLRLEESRRSSAVRRNLPLPSTLSSAAKQTLLGPAAYLPLELHAASQLVHEEMVHLIEHDSFSYYSPKEGITTSTRPTAVAPLEVLSDVYLTLARDSIQKEADGSQLQALQLTLPWDEYKPADAYNNIPALQQQFATLKAAIVADSRRAKALEEQLTQRMASSSSSLNSAITTITESYAKLSDWNLEIFSVSGMLTAEKDAVNERIARARAELATLLQLEQTLQQRYVAMQTS